MAKLWEYPAEPRRARAVPESVVPARVRRAAASAVELLVPYEWISANQQTLVQRNPVAPMTPFFCGASFSCGGDGKRDQST
jgi:hypothetical protein